MSKKTSELQWAEEVMEVYRALGSLPGNRAFSSPSAQYLFEQIAKGDEEYKFVSQVVPKAAEMLAKLKPADLDAAFVEIDRRTLSDLQKCLLDAVAASKDILVTPEPETSPEGLSAPQTEADLLATLLS